MNGTILKATNRDAAQRHFDLAWEMYEKAARNLHEAQKRLDQAEWELYESKQRDENWDIMQTGSNRATGMEAENTMNLSKARIENIFTEWHRRWQEDPESFFSQQELLSKDSRTAGEAGADYFIQLYKEGMVV